MSARIPLPDDLTRRPFTVAQALELGVSPSRLRNRDLAAPYRGIRSLAVPGEDGILGRCRAYAPLLRSGRAFSHLTAARIWGCPLPGNPATEPLHVSVLAPQRAPRLPGIVGHQHSTVTRIVQRQGIPVTDPATTWLALAPLIPLDDLIACGDHLAHDPTQIDPYDIRPHVLLESLRSLCEGYRGRGARAVADALALIISGSASPRETQLRLLLLRADLPLPQANADIFDARGRRIAIGDLVFAEYKVLAEYDGDQHRTSTYQYERDIKRIEALIAAGWIVIRVRNNGLLFDPEGTVERVAAALRSR